MNPCCSFVVVPSTLYGHCTLRLAWPSDFIVSPMCFGLAGPL